MNWLKWVLCFFILLNLKTIGHSQIELTLKSLEFEDPVAANFYVKKIDRSQERDLLEAEIAFLNEKFDLLDSILSHTKKTVWQGCNAARKNILQGLLAHKLNRYEDSQNSFKQAKLLLLKCGATQLQIASLKYWNGFTLLEQGELDLAEQELSSSLTFFLQDTARFHVKQAHTYFWIGAIKLKQNQFDSALTYLNRSLDIYRDLPLDKSEMLIKIYNNMGAAHNGLWNYKKAIQSYQDAINLNVAKRSDPEDLAISYSNLGRFYDLYENFSQSKECYNKAIGWTSKSNLSPDRKALIYQNYGTALSNQYQFVQAQTQYLIALNIIEPYKETYGDIYARVVINIAYSFVNQEQFSSAEKWEKELEHFFEDNAKRWPEQHFNWLLYKAIVDLLTGNFEKSIYSLDELEKIVQRDDEQYYEVLQIKASVLAKLNKFTESQTYIRKVINHYQNKLPITHPQLIQLYNELGSLFSLASNEHDSSYYYFSLAKKNNLLENPLDKHLPLYASKFEWIVSNYHLLELDIVRFHSGKLSLENLKQSEGFIFSTLSIIESKRIEFRNDQDVTNLYRMTHDFFDEAIKFYFTLYQHTGEEQYIDKAFFISEKSKYQTLQNAIKLDRVNAFAGVTTKVMQEEQKLGRQMAQLEYQYSQELAKQEEPLPELVQEYINNWRANSNRHNELVDSIKNNLPDYYNLKFNRSTTEINQLQSSILTKNQEMAWVSYYFGYTETYAIVITHDQKHFLKLNPSEKITRQLKSFNNYISQQMNDEFQKSSFDVYQLLFKAVDSCLARQAKKIKKVVIIPDGPLNYLNFELLGKPTNKSWHYALYDYQFSYGYSSTLLWTEFSDQLKWKPEGLSMIGFAPEFEGFTKSERNQTLREGSEKPDYDLFGFSPLQKNQEEVRQVAQILCQKKGKTSVYLGSQADESSFKKANLGSYNIIHLATHGFVSSQQQNVAGIAFAKKKNSADDGILYMDEIFSLKNKANLVCLSACETGSGVFQQGEGLVGLTRAFIYSGAQNLVVSLWKVQDESTSELMTHFYKGLVKSRSVSQSLHDAKITMIKKNPTLQPYHWSAFIHVGLN